jgi:hypothetical protein
MSLFWNGLEEADFRTSDITVLVPLVLRNYKHNPYEPNDSLGEAYGPIHQGVRYFSYPDDDDDYYFFELGTSSSVLIEVKNYRARGDLLLYDERGDLIGQWGRGGSQMEVGPLNLEPGRYYIRVYTDFDHNMDYLYELKYTVGTP